jgi:BA14K-like protein
MRPTTTSLSLAALALGIVLASAPAFAQTVGRPANDGGTITTPGNQPGNQSPPGGDYYQPQAGYQSNNLQMNAQGEQGAATDCAARFRSFDPATGTYLGFDGRRHSCP